MVAFVVAFARRENGAVVAVDVDAFANQPANISKFQVRRFSSSPTKFWLVVAFGGFCQKREWRSGGSHLSEAGRPLPQYYFQVIRLSLAKFGWWLLLVDFAKGKGMTQWWLPKSVKPAGPSSGPIQTVVT